MTEKKVKVKPKESGDIKKGRFSIVEMDFIRNNIKEHGVTWIAQELKRTEESIRDFAKRECLHFDEFIPNLEDEAKVIANELKETPEWEALKEEFNDKELVYFLYKYAKYVRQFKDDVLATEENQIFQSIKFELLMRRNLRAVKRAQSDVRRMENEITKLITKYEGQDMPDNTRALITNIENQILSARGAMGSRTTEYVKLQEKHSALFKELKATRDQRVSKIENSAKDIFQLLKNMQDPRFREKEGRQQTLVKMAVEKENKRLGDYHTYDDGSLDRQILSADTIGEDD